MRITLHLLFSLLNWIVKNAITNVTLHFFLIRKCKLVFLNPPVCSRGLRASLCFNIWWMWLQSAVLSHDSFCGKWAWAVRSLPAPDYVSYPRLLPCFTEYELNCLRRREDRPHFLIKRCPVGSHANFAKLNQCAIWDYPSAIQARLFEMFFVSFVWQLFKRTFKMSITNVFSVCDHPTGSLLRQDWFLRCVIFYSTQSVAEFAFSECGHGWEDPEIRSRAWNWIKSTWNSYKEEINGKWC